MKSKSPFFKTEYTLHFLGIILIIASAFTLQRSTNQEAMANVEVTEHTKNLNHQSRNFWDWLRPEAGNQRLSFLGLRHKPLLEYHSAQKLHTTATLGFLIVPIFFLLSNALRIYRTGVVKTNDVPLYTYTTKTSRNQQVEELRLLYLYSKSEGSKNQTLKYLPATSAGRAHEA